MPTSSPAAPPARSPSPRSGLRRSLHRASQRVEAAAIEVTKRLPEPLRQSVLRVVRVTRTARARGLGSRELAPQPHPALGEPQITVAVTSWNRAELLAIALRSVQRQDFESWECIVVDDASTDDAVLVAQSFAAVDARFRVFVHDAPQGPSVARNDALAAARAPLICFLDDDDFLLEGSLRARHEALVGQPVDVAGAFCDWVNVDADAGLEAFRPARRAPVRRGEISFASLLAGTPFILSAPLLRTNALRAAGGFDEERRQAEDAALWLRLCRGGYRFVDAAHVGIAYRRSAGSLVTADPAGQLRALDDVLAAADRPDPSVLGSGPLPAAEPLGVVASSVARRESILRYVAMIAATDPTAAEELGREMLTAHARRGISPAGDAAVLGAGAAARLGLDRASRAELVATVEGVLRRLVPELEPVPSEGVRPEAAEGQRAAAVRPPLAPRAASRSAVDGAVVLIPEARYHVDELGPLGAELERRGVTVRYMSSPKTVPAALAELGRYTGEVVAYEPAWLRSARAVVSLNDWGPLKEGLRSAGEHGVPTFAKVEGVQDFEDVESSWERRPYRSAAVVLAQGQNDVDALPEQETFVVGSSRLERIWHQRPAARGSHALVNLNFTFHVLAAARERWLESVEEGLRRAGVAGLVSRHPAERGSVFGLPVAAKPFRYEITRAGFLVTRFSTVAFEAIARGVPFVYHNPHGERFPAFQRSDGAFLVTHDAEELAAAAREVATWGDYRARARPFFLRQVDVDPGRTSAERAADVVLKVSA